MAKYKSPLDELREAFNLPVTDTSEIKEAIAELNEELKKKRGKTNGR